MALCAKDIWQVIKWPKSNRGIVVICIKLEGSYSTMSFVGCLISGSVGSLIQLEKYQSESHWSGQF